MGSVWTIVTSGTLLPEIFEPTLVIELDAITAMYGGSVAGGGMLPPALAAQLPPHCGRDMLVGARLASPLKLDGAGPPLSELRLDHCVPQSVTLLPAAAFWSPITNGPGTWGMLARTIGVIPRADEPLRIAVLWPAADGSPTIAFTAASRLPPEPQPLAAGTEKALSTRSVTPTVIWVNSSTNSRSAKLPLIGVFGGGGLVVPVVRLSTI